MPIYDYSCKQCQHPFTHLEPYARPDSEAPRCPRCGSAGVTRHDFPKAAPGWDIRGASAANNYGLKAGGKPSRKGGR